MGDWGKIIVAGGFKKLPKVQKIAQSVHSDQGKQAKRDLEAQKILLLN